MTPPTALAACSAGCFAIAFDIIVSQQAPNNNLLKLSREAAYTYVLFKMMEGMDDEAPGNAFEQNKASCKYNHWSDWSGFWQLPTNIQEVVSCRVWRADRSGPVESRVSSFVLPLNGVCCAEFWSIKLFCFLILLCAPFFLLSPNPSTIQSSEHYSIGSTNRRFTLCRDGYSLGCYWHSSFFASI